MLISIFTFSEYCPHVPMSKRISFCKDSRYTAVGIQYNFILSDYICNNPFSKVIVVALGDFGMKIRKIGGGRDIIQPIMVYAFLYFWSNSKDL